MYFNKLIRKLEDVLQYYENNKYDIIEDIGDIATDSFNEDILKDDIDIIDNIVYRMKSIKD